jgi:hypothetical protein
MMTGDSTVWVCRKCGNGDEIATISLVPRSQGTGPLQGRTIEEAMHDASYDTGWDEAYWESETITGYECRACSPGDEVKDLEDLVMKEADREAEMLQGDRSGHEPGTIPTPSRLSDVLASDPEMKAFFDELYHREERL